MRRRVHRKLYFGFGHRESKGADVSAFRGAVHKQLKHLKLGFLYQMRTPASRHHTIARCAFALGLSAKTQKAALRGEVGIWTQRKIRNPLLRSPLDRVRASKRRKIFHSWRVDHRKIKGTDITVMFDAVEPSQIPVDAPCVAGYTGGTWPTYHELPDLFPHAHHVSIAIAAHEDADVLDCEPGDASAADVPKWAKRQLQRRKAEPSFYNLKKPTAYGSVSTVIQIVAYLKAAGMTDEVNVMSAHIGQGEHICGPDTCGYPGLTESVKATQWIWTALGRNLDQSELGQGFL